MTLQMFVCCMLPHDTESVWYLDKDLLADRHSQFLVDDDDTNRERLSTRTHSLGNRLMYFCCQRELLFLAHHGQLLELQILVAHTVELLCSFAIPKK